MLILLEILLVTNIFSAGGWIIGNLLNSVFKFILIQENHTTKTEYRYVNDCHNVFVTQIVYNIKEQIDLINSSKVTKRKWWNQHIFSNISLNFENWFCKQ